jgi:hypothetical protein
LQEALVEKPAGSGKRREENAVDEIAAWYLRKILVKSYRLQFSPFIGKLKPAALLGSKLSLPAICG